MDVKGGSNGKPKKKGVLGVGVFGDGMLPGSFNTKKNTLGLKKGKNETRKKKRKGCIEGG